MSKTESNPKLPLGKGISSLLGGVEYQPSLDQNSDQSEVILVSPNSIDPNPEQPRKEFHHEELKSLAKSIEKMGVIQPIIVCKGVQPGRYILIAGERRLRASRLAGLTQIPAIEKKLDRSEWLKLALIENIQRSDLNCIEEAKAYHSLIVEYGLTHEECSKQVGKDRTTISNYLRILNLPIQIQNDLVKNTLAMGHAKALLHLDNEADQLKARDLIIKRNLSVRSSEQLCKSLGNDPQKSDKLIDPDLEYIADQLRDQLKTKVRLVGGASRGKIEVSYFSSQDLERILAAFK